MRIPISKILQAVLLVLVQIIGFAAPTYAVQNSESLITELEIENLPVQTQSHDPFDPERNGLNNLYLFRTNPQEWTSGLEISWVGSSGATIEIIVWAVGVTRDGGAGYSSTDSVTLSPDLFCMDASATPCLASERVSHGRVEVQISSEDRSSTTRYFVWIGAYSVDYYVPSDTGDPDEPFDQYIIEWLTSEQAFSISELNAEIEPNDTFMAERDEVFRGWSFSPGGDILPDWTIIYSHQSLYAVLLEPPGPFFPLISIFGTDFTLQYCDLASEDICVYQTRDGYDVTPEENHIVDETSIYSVIDVENDFFDASDDPSQTIEFDWSELSENLNVSISQLTSVDYRFPYPSEAVSVNLPRLGSVELSDSDLCNVDLEKCHLVFSLQLNYEFGPSGETQSHSFFVYFILEDNAGASYEVSYDDLSEFSGTPASTETFTGTVWQEWPDYLDESFDAIHEGYFFDGWTADGNFGTVSVSEMLHYMPVVESSRVVPNLIPYYEIRFESLEEYLGSVRGWGEHSLHSAIDSFEEAYEFDPNQPRFSHWALEEDGDPLAEDAYTTNAMTLFAVWSDEIAPPVENSGGGSSSGGSTPGVVSRPPTPSVNLYSAKMLRVGGNSIVSLQLPKNLVGKTARLVRVKKLKSETSRSVLDSSAVRNRNDSGFVKFKFKQKVKSDWELRVRIEGKLVANLSELN